MVQEASTAPDDVQQLRRRFDEFRSTQASRSRLPETLWAAAAELAKRYGVNPTARALRLDYTGLRKRVENPDRPKPKKGGAPPPAFVELLTPVSGAVTNCSVEVESVQGGKLRLELKAVATTERANLIRAFVGF
jgi:hypothetical protein